MSDYKNSGDNYYLGNLLGSLIADSFIVAGLYLCKFNVTGFAVDPTLVVPLVAGTYALVSHLVNYGLGYGHSVYLRDSYASLTKHSVERQLVEGFERGVLNSTLSPVGYLRKIFL